MTNNLSNIAVYIKDVDMLEKARCILDRYNQSVDLTWFWLSPHNPNDNYLIYKDQRSFTLFSINDEHTKITLPELERLLKKLNEEKQSILSLKDEI